MADFMSLPPELRDRIYHFAFGGPHFVVTNSRRFPEPGLLQVNRQIRHEASPVFYRISNFDANLTNWDGVSFFAMRQKQIAIFRRHGFLFGSRLTTPTTPNWPNFKRFLFLIHYFGVTASAGGPGPITALNILRRAEIQLVHALWVMVYNMHHLPWHFSVEPVVEAYHHVLVSFDPRWT